MSKHSGSKASRDNRANQLNPQHTQFHQSRGAPQDTAVVKADAVRAANETNSEPGGADSSGDTTAQGQGS